MVKVTETVQLHKLLSLSQIVEILQMLKLASIND